jgi:ATP-dependent protease ClpP protease subunit
MAGTPTQQQLPSEIYASLTGPIDQVMVQRVFQGITVAIQASVKTVHLFFHSNGGTVGDGISLYNYFRALPLELHIYNGGTVSSIAVIAFLGARHRYASTYATFMVHRTYATSALFTSAAAANATRLHALTQGLEIDDTRTRSILQAHIKLSDLELDDRLTNEVPFDANAALQCGLISAVREFEPPTGTKLFNL